MRRLLGVPHGLTPAEAEDRLRHLVEGNSDLEEDEREMIASVIELGEQPVREIMVPRIDIVAAPVSATVRDVLDRIVDSGHSRIPIFDESIDNITGVVYAKDLLRYLRDGSQNAPVQPLAREPSFVPETKKVDELLHEMQHTPRARLDRGRRVRRHGGPDHHRGPDRGDRRRDPGRVRRRGVPDRGDQRYARPSSTRGSASTT